MVCLWCRIYMFSTSLSVARDTAERNVLERLSTKFLIQNIRNALLHGNYLNFSTHCFWLCTAWKRSPLEHVFTMKLAYFIVSTERWSRSDGNNDRKTTTKMVGSIISFWERKKGKKTSPKAKYQFFLQEKRNDLVRNSLCRVLHETVVNIL